MPCLYPLQAFRSVVNGSIVWSRSKAQSRHAAAVWIPCRKCIGCRLDHASSWAVRCTHEAKMHTDNCFVTLTYDDKHLPDDYSISRRALTLFFKRVRNNLGIKFRFFACGEYGEQGTRRPHYHVLFFGYRPSDGKLWRKTPAGFPSYRSKELETCWGLGNVEWSDLTVQSAGYVARYAVKKVHGDRAAEHYARVHPITNKRVQVTPEFCQMSNRPGIGTPWFEKYSRDAFPSDFVIIDGKKHPVPRYYLDKLDEEKIRLIKLKRYLKQRQANRLKFNDDQLRVPNFAQLEAKAVILQQRAKLLRRPLQEPDNQ